LPAAEDAGLAGGKELAEYTETKRNAAHDAVNAAVKSDRLRVFLVDFFRWMEVGNWHQRTSAKPQKSIEDFARAALKKRRKKLVKQAASLADLDPRSRHKIRIKAKKLRYMVEFFKTLAKNSEQLTRFLRCLEELQTRLGKIHDEEAKIAFLQEEVRNLPEDASHSAAFAAGVLAGAPDDTSHQLERSIEAYSELAKANPF
jgi:triphosphatase